MRVAAALFLALVATPAFAADRAAVLDLLSAYEDTPTAAQLQALGPGVDAELLAIADDASVPPTRRARAVSAVRFFPSPTVDAWLEEKLRSTDTLAILRRKAAWSLAATEGAGAVPLLANALGDPDVQLRIAAAQALGTVTGDAARTALAQRLAVEVDPAAREALAKAMGVSR